MDRPWDGAVRLAKFRERVDDRTIRVTLECGHDVSCKNARDQTGPYEMPQFYACPRCRAEYVGSERQREVEAFGLRAALAAYRADHDAGCDCGPCVRAIGLLAKEPHNGSSL